MRIYDIHSAIFLAKNPAYHSKMKHIDVQYHFVRDMVERKKVLLEKVDTSDNFVDYLKKYISTDNFSFFWKTWDHPRRGRTSFLD